MAAFDLVNLYGLLDDETCFALVRQHRWPGGVRLPVHKVPAVRRAIEAAGAQLLFLPLYSPDLNPIEMVFSQMKAKLRHEIHRCGDALWRTLGRIANAITPTQCANYFRHCGYLQSA